MSGFSSGNRGLCGKRLYVAIAVWFILVLVGGFCTWYGWFGPGSGSSPQEAETTPTDESITPTAEMEATAVPPAPTIAATLPPVPQEEEVFGYGVAAHGVVGDADYTMGQVESLGLGWVKQQVRWAHFEGNPGQMDWSGYDWVVDAANKRGIKVMFSVVDAPHWSRTYFDDNVG
jgi:hypothetical protein